MVEDFILVKEVLSLNESSVVSNTKWKCSNQGNAIFAYNQAMISLLFEQNSIIILNNNEAVNGGAVFSKSNIANY